MRDRGTEQQVSQPLVVILGPTAVGKSRVAVHLAQALGTEILTADSRQVYRGMDIGTEKPDAVDRSAVPHRLIDLVDPDQPFNVGIYRRAALEEISRVRQAGHLPLVVGGTGLYIRALTRGLWDGPSADWNVRTQLMEEAQRDGSSRLHARLAAVDPDLAERLHPHDTVKIIRGLEVYQLIGKPLSGMHQSHGFQDTPFFPLLIGLHRDRQALYQRINARIDSEIARGLVEETERLLGQGYGRHLPSMKGLGYRQISGYLTAEYDFDEAIQRLKRDTRHFAKRQMTWFRKEPNIEWISLDEGISSEKIAEDILVRVQRYQSQLTEGR